MAVNLRRNEGPSAEKMGDSTHPLLMSESPIIHWVVISRVGSRKMGSQNPHIKQFFCEINPGPKI